MPIWNVVCLLEQFGRFYVYYSSGIIAAHRRMTASARKRHGTWAQINYVPLIPIDDVVNELFITGNQAQQLRK